MLTSIKPCPQVLALRGLPQRALSAGPARPSRARDERYLELHLAAENEQQVVGDAVGAELPLLFGPIHRAQSRDTNVLNYRPSRQ